MNDLKLTNKQDYARAVCLFLAEGLRTRRIALTRALEIAQKVLDNLNLLDTEYDFLRLIKELSNDFEELLKLEQRVFLYVKSDERAKTELVVKDFVVNQLSTNMAEAVKVMDEVINHKVSLDQLKTKYPAFKTFIESNAKSRTAKN